MSAGFRSKQTHGYYAVTRVLAQTLHESDKTRRDDFHIREVSDNAWRNPSGTRQREDISLTSIDIHETEEDESPETHYTETSAFQLS